MWLIFLGPPGSGKGTQAKKLAFDFSVPHISTGDMLREAVARETSAGIKARDYMNKGELVPDEVIDEILVDRLKRDDCFRGVILDGYPRTIPQAETLSGALKDLKVDLIDVIEINVSVDALIKRICGRRSCPSCGATFHIDFLPPRKEGICDKCGKSLVRRADDNEEVVKARYEQYLKKTQPLSEYYKNKGVFRSINGEEPVDEIYKTLLSLLKPYGND